MYFGSCHLLIRQLLSADNWMAIWATQRHVFALINAIKGSVTLHVVENGLPTSFLEFPM